MHQKSVLDVAWLPRGHAYIFLPPYSPQLNPIEEAFSAVKNEVRKGLARRLPDICATDHLPWGQKSHVRAQILRQALCDFLGVVTPVKAHGWYNHIQGTWCEVFFLQ